MVQALVNFTCEECTSKFFIVTAEEPDKEHEQAAISFTCANCNASYDATDVFVFADEHFPPRKVKSGPYKVSDGGPPGSHFR